MPKYTPSVLTFPADQVRERGVSGRCILLKTTVLFKIDHGIISVVGADNLLAGHLEPDDVRVFPESPPPPPSPLQGHIVGEELIDLKTGGGIRVKEPNPVNESVPDTEGLHSFEKEVVVDSVEGLLLTQKNEGRLHILIIGQLYEVQKHMDSVIDSPAIHRGLGVVDDGRKDMCQPG